MNSAPVTARIFFRPATQTKDVWGGGGGRGDAIRQNFRAKLLRRRRDRDQSVAMHPESVNAALSASTAPSLPSLSLTSCTYKCCDGEHQAAFWELSCWSDPKFGRWGGGFWKQQSPLLFSEEEVVELRPSMIGPCRRAPRLIRWPDHNFVKGTGCFLCWLNISV